MSLATIKQVLIQFMERISSFFSQLTQDAGSMERLTQLLSSITQFMLPMLAILVVVRCGRSLLQGKLESEGWGWLTDAKGNYRVLRHWEVLLGRSRACDISLSDPTVSRNHAALIRDDHGSWLLYPIQSRNITQLNHKPVQISSFLKTGDVISLGNTELVFHATTPEQEAEQARARTRPGKVFSPGVTLILLTLFQGALCLQLTNCAAPEDIPLILTGFGTLAVIMWSVYTIYRIFRRTGFEIETLAFFLTSLCLTVTALSSPSKMQTQLIAVIIGLVLFFILSIVLRDLERAKKLRWPAAVGATILLAMNLLLAAVHFGAKNWIRLGPISFQPSELVKVVFVLVGATTLDRMFAKRNLIATLIFSAYCVGCLALMSDFGTALIFFVAFLAIAFLRSGDLPSVAFMTAAAAFACVIILKFKPYIARRFSIYGHVWDDPSGLGYQQTRTLSAIASGGLFGQGVGNGWLKHIGAANTDLVFGVIAEELGLIIAVLAVVVILLLALFAVKSSAAGRSSFYVIASCTTAVIFLMQTILNVFGSTDLLPLTGVTFPFVSCGGSSMMACWCLLAYIKASDTRQNAGLAVKLPKKIRQAKGSSSSVQIPFDSEDEPTQPEIYSGTSDLDITMPLSASQADLNRDSFSARLNIHREDNIDQEDKL